MNFLYISPEFPPNYANFIRQLDRLGVYVWAIGEADFYDLPEDLRSCLRWYEKTQLNNFQEVEKSVDHLLAIQATSGGPDGFDVVESHNEHWLRLEGFINERYGIEGIKLQDLDRLKKKSVMKQAFKKNGLRIARGGTVKDLDQSVSLANELGYPVILKPDEGVGAGGIHKVHNIGELKALLPELQGEYLMEEFIEAKIITYDGLTDKIGNVVFENSLIYGEGVLEYIFGKDTFFYISRSIPDRLAGVGKILTGVFNIRRKFFHFEFFDLGGDYVPIEINCRPPGGAILDMMNYSIDGDLYHAYARMVSGDRIDLPQEKKYYCSYLGRRDKNYAYSHSDICSRFGGRLVEHAENPPLFREAMGRYRYIFRSKEEAEILDIAEFVLKTP